MFRIFFNKRGAALTEYAVLLAFVAAIGVSFASDNGLAASIKDTISKVEKVLGAEVGDLPGGGNDGSSEEGNGGGETPGDGGGSNEDNKTDDNENTKPGDPSDVTPPKEDPPKEETPTEPPTYNSDIKFSNGEEEALYGDYVRSLVDYLLNNYGKMNEQELVSANISGNNGSKGDRLELTYKDGSKQTVDIDFKKELGSDSFDIKKANIHFDGTNLVNGSGKQDVSIEIDPVGNGNDKVEVILKDGELAVKK